jgi:Cdc6-like AAA superfamily ATPase
MHRVETQHLELQDSHSTWLHTAEVQHKATDNQETVVQEQITLTELAQAEAVKVNGLTHGEQAAVVAELAEQVINPIFVTLAQEDTQATLVDQETHQRVHQVEAQDLLTLMIQEEEVKAVQVDQAYTD